MPSLVSASARESLTREVLGATRERMLREMEEALEGRILQRKRTHKKSNLMLVHFRVPQFVPKDTSDIRYHGITRDATAQSCIMDHAR
jgi:hypothetical protein